MQPSSWTYHGTSVNTEFEIDSYMPFRTSLRALFVLLPIFGLTWLIGIFGFSSDAVAAMYIFVIMNSSQGLLMFIFHCALNQEVRISHVDIEQR